MIPIRSRDTDWLKKLVDIKPILILLFIIPISLIYFEV